uniref:Poly(A) polymerase alpha n=1 Tax=Myotis myotis TaxID=51298 RepID=A0A7J8ANP1_MYOMY|nr:poly(A) polymerase alpha [Myotis myotis]
MIKQKRRNNLIQRQVQLNQRLFRQRLLCWPLRKHPVQTFLISLLSLQILFLLSRIQ